MLGSRCSCLWVSVWGWAAFFFLSCTRSPWIRSYLSQLAEIINDSRCGCLWVSAWAWAAFFVLSCTPSPACRHDHDKEMRFLPNDTGPYMLYVGHRYGAFYCLRQLHSRLYSVTMVGEDDEQGLMMPSMLIDRAPRQLSHFTDFSGLQAGAGRLSEHLAPAAPPTLKLRS